MIPGLVVGFVVGVLHYFVHPPIAEFADGGTVIVAYSPGVPPALIGFLVALLALVGTIVTIAYTTGMAAAAWKNGTTTLQDGADAWRENGVQIFLALVGLVVLAIVATGLSLLTFGLALLAFALFTLYTMAAVIIGKQQGFSAILASFRLTAARFVPTLIIAVALTFVFIVIAIIGEILSFIPLLGPLVAGILQQGVAAFATLVIVGEYLLLSRSTPAAAAAQPPL